LLRLAWQDIGDINGRSAGWRRPLPSLTFHALLLFSIQLFADLFRHIVVRLQGTTILDVPDQASQMVCPEPIMFLANTVPPAMRSQVAGRPRAPHEIVDSVPHGRLTGRLFLGMKLCVSFRKHVLRIASFAALSNRCARDWVRLFVIERDFHRKLLAD
jgi:hypothetical protein